MAQVFSQSLTQMRVVLINTLVNLVNLVEVAELNLSSKTWAYVSMCFLSSVCFQKVVSYTIMGILGFFPRGLQYYNKQIEAKKIRIV